MGITDPVVWGSIAALAITIGIFVYLVFKIKVLMNRDEESHRQK